ncbi:MAG: dihydroorotate dehydrogenase [Planctomycetota bacterium]|nr:MAG: dihydroorotate dehydrogenase [Planctomycetota bacterium]
MTRPADDERLAVDLAGLRLRSPVLLAAGTAGYADELADAIDLRRVGGVVTKSITAEPRAGNETWRVAEVPGGMLNAIGLANVGADRFRDEIAPRLSAAPATVIGSIAGHSAEEYARVARMFDAIDTVPAVEVNVSCPNVADGSVFGEAPDALGRLVAALRPALARTKLIVKLPPAAGGDGPAASIVSLARAAIDAGADGLTIANTIPAMAVDPETREPLLANVTGGLSGPAVHPVIVRLVHLAHRHAARQSQVPIIAVGGVVSWRQAAEFILVGASAVQVGTATFADPRAPLKILSGLGRWVRRQGVASVMDLVGAVRLPGGAR